MSLKGSPELKARLRAIRQSFKPVGKAWADATAKSARRRVPRRTGRLMNSIRVRNASQRKATVVGHYSANFVDAGTKAHDIVPKKAAVLAYGSGGTTSLRSHGNTIFSARVNHPRTSARPFKKAAAQDGLKANPMAKTIIDEWNRAA